MTMLILAVKKSVTAAEVDHIPIEAANKRNGNAKSRIGFDTSVALEIRTQRQSYKIDG